jgi:hypothetical protein
MNHCLIFVLHRVRLVREHTCGATKAAHGLAQAVRETVRVHANPRGNEDTVVRVLWQAVCHNEDRVSQA